MQYRILITALLTTALAMAQGRGSTGGTSTTNPSIPGSTTRPGSFPSSTSPNGSNPFPGTGTRPIMISGKVVLDDGTAPPPSILIERVCAGGRPHPEAYTDSKGRFTATLGQELGMMADASETPNRNELPGANPAGGGIREDQLAGCDLRATLAGYRSDTVSLAGKRYMDDADVGTIILHRMANVEGLTISATSAMAPKDAQKAYLRGMEAVKKSKPDDAQKDFEKAVGIYPKYAAAWFELGRIYEQRDHIDQALHAYDQSVAADSKYVNPYERIYILDAKAKKWPETAELSDKVLHLNPYDFPSAYYFNGLANLELQHLDVAEKSMREAIKLDVRHENPRATYLLGIILAQKHDFPAAAEYLQAYLKDVPAGNDSDTVRKQLADIQKLAQTK
jgi:tetratricopeptide (TPR) repeat protein